ncbi:MAG: allophanate hydrolase [Bradyrhizobium sp.]|nr:MAG: allophanate hydrolase [Bradyrhizobium sp.]
MDIPVHSIAALLKGYAERRWSVTAVAEDVLARVTAAEAQDPAIWISRVDRETLLAQAAALDARGPAGLPLFGVPFAVKDNIDVAGLPTTAACPDFAYSPGRSATVVERLVAAGAFVVGKTNLDQFATGLVGVRSPYGAPRSPFDRAYVSGGSSSGSAVAASRGLVSFALGTDTAGSGRVPAAYCNLIGLKPSRGLISAAGVVPACQSLDCVSIFATNADDAAAALAAAAGFDAADPYSRAPLSPPVGPLSRAPARFRFGVPRKQDLIFLGDKEVETLFEKSVERLSSLGGEAIEIDLSPFFEVARLLYEGPWIAERTAAVGAFIAAHRSACNPTVAGLIAKGGDLTAPAAFEAIHRLEALRRATEATWSAIDVMLTPTAPTAYTVEAVLADPIRLNATLGLYTNFVNFLDLAAVNVPAGFGASGRPVGVTLVGPTHSDRALLSLGDALHRAAAPTAGALGLPLPPQGRRNGEWTDGGGFDLVAVGAHMSGLPLSYQLADIGGRPVAATLTAPIYRLYALDNLDPPRPGLVRVEDGGAAIEAEIWRLPASAFGAFVASVEQPHAIGKVALEDGRWLPGFLCDPLATRGRPDIGGYGGWRKWLAAKGSRKAKTAEAQS